MLVDRDLDVTPPFLIVAEHQGNQVRVRVRRLRITRTLAFGQDLETFVLQAVPDKLAESELQLKIPRSNGRDWAEKLHAGIDLHPVVTHFVDDSRESIYARRGE